MRAAPDGRIRSDARPAMAALARAAADRPNGAGDPPETGPFHGLFQKHNALERLIADAGPLGKYKTDQPDQMPSGTSALTMRIGDALNRVAARLGTPFERILPSNTTFVPAIAVRPPAEMLPGQGATAPQPDQRIRDPRPAVATDTDIRARSAVRGNGEAPGA